MVKSFKYFWKKKTYLSWGAGASLFVLKQFNSALNIIVFNAKRPFGKSQRANLWPVIIGRQGLGSGDLMGITWFSTEGRISGHKQNVKGGCRKLTVIHLCKLSVRHVGAHLRCANILPSLQCPLSNTLFYEYFW